MEHQNQHYICPMHCEINKTYNQPGDCPVCNMHLVPVNEKNKHGEPHHVDHHQEHGHEARAQETGKYFCPMHCEGDKTYDKPGDCPVCGMHLQKAETKKSSGVVYTCPMHPEIIKDKKGDCDICAMPLVTSESMGYLSVSETESEAPIVIPATAPLITGKRAVVYVEVPEKDGTFEGREVVLCNLHLYPKASSSSI